MMEPDQQDLSSSQQSTTSSTSRSTISTTTTTILEDTLKALDDGSDIPAEQIVGVVQNTLAGGGGGGPGGGGAGGDNTFLDIDSILAKGLSQLTMKERESVYYDLHGVSEVQSESDETFVQDKLQQLQSCLNSITIDDYNIEAYEHAMYLSTEYVTNPKFQLLFLRAHDFNPKDAAICLIQHFSLKLELFGIERLVRDITLQDLSKEGKEVLESGYQQRLPIRDRADRAVFCILPPLLTNDIQARNQSYWYTTMTELKDETTSRNGQIIVIFNTGPNRKGFEEASYIKEFFKMRNGLPMKTNAIHFNYDSQLMIPIVTFFTVFLPKKMRARFRHHYGANHSEHVYNLQTYGIPAQVLPLDENGTPFLDYHKDWLKRCIVHETETLQKENTNTTTMKGTTTTTSSSTNTVLIPRRFDVLFGKGKNAAEHTGNLRAFHIVEMNRELYEKASKHEKTYLAEKIVKLIKQSYGRFLKMERDGVWHEVNDELAREKISHCFRRLRELDSVQHKAKTTTAKRTNQEELIKESSRATNSSSSAAAAAPLSPGKRTKRPSSS